MVNLEGRIEFRYSVQNKLFKNYFILFEKNMAIPSFSAQFQQDKEYIN